MLHLIAKNTLFLDMGVLLNGNKIPWKEINAQCDFYPIKTILPPTEGFPTIQYINAQNSDYYYKIIYEILQTYFDKYKNLNTTFAEYNDMLDMLPPDWRKDRKFSAYAAKNEDRILGDLRAFSRSIEGEDFISPTLVHSQTWTQQARAATHMFKTLAYYLSKSIIELNDKNDPELLLKAKRLESLVDKLPEVHELVPECKKKRNAEKNGDFYYQSEAEKRADMEYSDKIEKICKWRKRTGAPSYYGSGHNLKDIEEYLKKEGLYGYKKQ